MKNHTQYWELVFYDCDTVYEIEFKVNNLFEQQLDHTK